MNQKKQFCEDGRFNKFKNLYSELHRTWEREIYTCDIDLIEWVSYDGILIPALVTEDCSCFGSIDFIIEKKDKSGQLKYVRTVALSFSEMFCFRVPAVLLAWNSKDGETIDSFTSIDLFNMDEMNSYSPEEWHQRIIQFRDEAILNYSKNNIRWLDSKFDSALVANSFRYGLGTVPVYDRTIMAEILITEGMTPSEANHHIYHVIMKNIVGKNSPVIIIKE